MVRILLLIFTFLLTQISTAQQEEDNAILFSEALTLHLPKYEKRAKDAYFYRDYEKAQKLFDSLTRYQLAGSYMDDFKFKNLRGKKISLHNFKKPVYLITYASWCVTSQGEVPALNELADKYQDKIDFVILFWDSKIDTRKASKDYSKNIHITYVDELDNKDPHVVRNLKHSLGLPTTFLLDKDKKILNIRRGVTHKYGKSFEESLDANYNSIYDGIANHLLGDRNFEPRPEPVALNN
ncbi:TlpA family protein disulfide reductase [Antarcticibacterium flavum]|uniref:TlpA family protein disulfide reductase n=1 Tax=Antarcticibacterium flavum TaxID=2058175 RepID=A0A5B7X9B8_9FLAO|nr:MULTISPECIES: TlpA disulfide reductase family protein [Antarcticibacterium]MCM4160380.1 thioredoxin family protein [Antarcticibacterium sp. W02-3]QCY71243.1 TlpA family protein disulfide reductase [Antarcticibacterium flavum]